MKTKYAFLSFVILVLIVIVGCQKDKTNIDYPPVYGKWTSIAQFNNGQWAAIVQPHTVELKNQASDNFIFIDHNGIACTGNYQFTTENGKYYVKFPSASCGFATREITIVSTRNLDTIELRVLNAPNITPERVRYAR